MRRLALPALLAVLTLLAALGGLAALAPAADAAQRYAAPDPEPGADCSQAQPCGLDEAVNAAQDGDEVIVAPGDYVVGSPLNADLDAIDVHGVPGERRPLIVSTVERAAALSVRGGGRAAHLSIDVAGLGARAVRAELGAGMLEDLVLTAGGPSQVALDVGSADGTLARNVVALATGTSGTGIHVRRSGGVALRNVTALALDDEAAALLVESSQDAGSSVDVRNTILGGARWDVYAAAEPGLGSQVQLAHSQVVPARIGGNGEVTLGEGTVAHELFGFADAEAHLPDDSPFIDAGAPDPLLATHDYDGDLRSAGSAPDIGADEVPEQPAAQTAAPDPVGHASATLRGVVQPSGGATTYQVQWGPTTEYGNRTPERRADPASAEHAVAEPVSGLTPGTTYHYRIVARNSRGTVATEDRSFTTPAAPSPGNGTGGGTGGGAPDPGTGGRGTPGGGTGGGTSPGDAARPRVLLVSRRVAVRGRHALVRLSCAAGADCRGSLVLSVRGRRAGRAAYDLRGGTERGVRVRLARSTLAAVRRAGRVSARLAVSPSASAEAVVRRVTLRAVRGPGRGAR